MQKTRYCLEPLTSCQYAMFYRMAKLVFSDRHGCLAENGYWLMTNFIAKCERNAIPDEQIDTSDIPELTEEDFARGHSKYRIHPLELTFLAAMI